MIVFLDESLFADGALQDILLLNILRLGSQGRFKVRAHPPYQEGANHPLNRWLLRQSPNARDQARLGLNRGLREYDYALPQKDRELRVILKSCDQKQWPAEPSQTVQLPLDEETEHFLRSPLSLLLENSRNDWGFLRKAVPAAWRERLDQACRRRWIDRESGGGVDEMRRIIEDQIAYDPARRLRTWALFDSDARSQVDRDQSEPKRSASGSERTEAACQCTSLAYYRLRRRSIENYIPKASLYDWARRGLNKDQRNSRLAVVDAFFAMATSEQRHYFNMKGGFAADRKPPGRVAAIYEFLDSSMKSALERGFHLSREDELVSIWREEEYLVDQDAMRADGSEDERNQLFQSLFARL